MVDLDRQFTIFLYSLLIGLYLGVTYDLVDLFLLKRLKKPAKGLFQILFFIIQSAIVFRVLFHVNDGAIFLYCYLLFFVGFLLYQWMAKGLRQEGFPRIEKAAFWLFQCLQRLFSFLIVEPILDLIRVFKAMGRQLHRGIKWFGKKTERPLNWVKRKMPKPKMRYFRTLFKRRRGFRVVVREND